MNEDNERGNMASQADEDYNKDVEAFGAHEYPMLEGTTYLDHAGTTPYPRSLIERFSQQMLSNLYGNPHSASNASQLSTRCVDDIRIRALRFFNADPDHFDLIFVPNATAGIKLVVDAFREEQGGFWYGYHKDSHTSLVGARGLARRGQRCFMSDEEVEKWLGSDNADNGLSLFAYPAQSNMNGRRLPSDWAGRLRSRSSGKTYSLLDAAALVSTSPLDLGDPSAGPDFTVLSFYKIFGSPDLGALIVKKDSGALLQQRSYFGGGTVEMVACGKESWHISKQGSLHESLEDGTLPVHSILALGIAFDVHASLYSNMSRVSRHTSFLARRLRQHLAGLYHFSGVEVCILDQDSTIPDFQLGPIVAFNLQTSRRTPISNTEVERLANVRNIHLRSGGLCNPGGLASALHLAPWDLKRNFSAGQRCGGEQDILDGKPTGLLRVSLGAMSTLEDVSRFTSFVEEFFVERQAPSEMSSQTTIDSAFYIEALNVYPIKSCGAWAVPPDTSWPVRNEGLAWDREWCIVHQGTHQALSQKKYPRMALIKPSIDLEQGVLCIRYHGPLPETVRSQISVPLSGDPTVFSKAQEPQSLVCGDAVKTQTYSAPEVVTFFSSILGTSCTLARLSSTISGHDSTAIDPRPSKLGRSQKQRKSTTSITSPVKSPSLLLSNESPILIISRSSLNRLNENIKRLKPQGRAAKASVFRANIVLAEEHNTSGFETPFAEDHWRGVHIRGENSVALHGGLHLTVWGGCRRCQMVCIDQTTAEKDEEPFVTLSKTRRRAGKGVFFGVHASLAHESDGSVGQVESSLCATSRPMQTLCVGDKVWPVGHTRDDEE